MPIIFENSIVAVAQLVNKMDGTEITNFTEKDVAHFRGFAGYAAASLRNTRLFRVADHEYRKSESMLSLAHTLVLRAPRPRPHPAAWGRRRPNIRHAISTCSTHRFDIAVTVTVIVLVVLVGSGCCCWNGVPVIIIIADCCCQGSVRLAVYHRRSPPLPLSP